MGNAGGNTEPLNIYLDQNKWIALSKLFHGGTDSSVSESTLKSFLEARDSLQARFPLSVGHYQETWSHGDAERRKRLAAFMAELSQFWAMAPPARILEHEIETALAALFPIEPAEFSLVGKFLAHATGNAEHTFRFEWPAGLPARAEHIRLITDAFVRRAEEIAISGVLPNTAEVLRLDLRDLDARFQQGLTDWRKQLDGLSPDEIDERIYSITLDDIRPYIVRVLEKHNLDVASFDSLPRDQKRGLLDQLPSRRVDMHLRREISRNMVLQIRPTDLNDWGFVGTAAAHCDIVVTDNQMAHLLGQPGPDRKAIVTAKLDEVPTLIADLNCSSD